MGLVALQTAMKMKMRMEMEITSFLSSALQILSVPHLCGTSLAAIVDSASGAISANINIAVPFEVRPVSDPGSVHACMCQHSMEHGGSDSGSQPGIAAAKQLVHINNSIRGG